MSDFAPGEILARPVDGGEWVPAVVGTHVMAVYCGYMRDGTGPIYDYEPLDGWVLTAWDGEGPIPVD